MKIGKVITGTLLPPTHTVNVFELYSNKKSDNPLPISTSTPPFSGLSPLSSKILYPPKWLNFWKIGRGYNYEGDQWPWIIKFADFFRIFLTKFGKIVFFFFFFFENGVAPSLTLKESYNFLEWFYWKGSLVLRISFQLYGIFKYYTK